jgi:hypothetical protein
MLTACGGGGTHDAGVAHLGTTTISKGSSGSANNPTKFAECMRSHGIVDFPDPGPSGGFAINAQPGSDLDPRSAPFQAATKACQQYDPSAGKPPSPAEQAEGLAQLLKFSQCMRSHGISDYPDPTQSGIQIKPGGPNSDLNPNNPRLEAAQTACQRYSQPGPGVIISNVTPPAGGGGSPAAR